MSTVTEIEIERIWKQIKEIEKEIFFDVPSDDQVEMLIELSKKLTRLKKEAARRK